MRRIDGLGIVGFGMLLVGALTFLSGSSAVPMWVAWLVGPLLWYLGFAVIIAWMVYRLFVPAAAVEMETAPEPVRAPVRLARSNFHEHDCEIPLTEASFSRIPVFGTALLVVAMSIMVLIQK
jgi:hypothetical protein